MLAAAGLAVALLGCEKKGSTSESELMISPKSTYISYGQSIEFQVFNGHTLNWSLSSPTIGRIVATTPTKAVYTASAPMPGRDVTQILKVRSFRTDLVTPPPEETVEAYIVHKGVFTGASTSTVAAASTTTTSATTTTTTTGAATTTTTPGTTTTTTFSTTTTTVGPPRTFSPQPR